WEVIFDGDAFPPDGTHVIEGTVSDPDGTATDLFGPEVLIDTAPPDLTIDSGTVANGDIFNALDHSDGVEVSGTVEPGASVQVTIGSQSVEATVDATGHWSVILDDSVLPGGEYTQEIIVSATDGVGNGTIIADAVEIDTIPNPLTIDAVTGDDLISGAEADAGFAITGTCVAGATVTVTVGDFSQDVVTAADGTWTLAIAAGAIAGGEYAATITASSVDTVGNPSSISHDVRVDTVSNVEITNLPLGGDDLINAAEHQSGTTLTGTAQVGSSVVVTIGDVSQTVVVGQGGTWAAVFTSSDLAPGTYTTTAQVTATDTAGNVSTTSHTFAVDTEISATIDTGLAGGDGLLNAGEAVTGLILTGTADAGAALVVTFQGNTYTTSATAEGTWSLSVPAGDIAAGTYDAAVSVTATDAAGNTVTTEGTVSVDTESAVTFDAAAVGGDGTVNAAERSAGVTLTGTAHSGSAVTVTIAGVSYSAAVADNGDWSLALSAADLPEGTSDITADVTAVSAAGNIATTSGTFHVDTETFVTVDTSAAGGDGTVNAAERADGVVLTGQAEAGALVMVDVAGVAHAAIVAADGHWSVSIAAADLPEGTRAVDVTVTATDAAGNEASVTDSFALDTETAISLNTADAGGDGVVNAAERAEGVALAGQAEPGAAVMVTMGSTTQPATVAADGSWTVTFSADQVPTGETTVPVSATSTDAAGNVATASGEVAIDTLVRDFAITGTPGGADGVINAAEAAQGLTLTGTTEPGATVTLVLDGVSLPATVAADGSWTATFAAADLPSGERTVDLVARSTDAAGNTDTLTQAVVIDTDAGVLTISDAPVEGDDVINAVEASDGVVLTGTSNPGQMVEVTLDGITHTVPTDDAGIWRAEFAAGEITPGTHEAQITATITDAAGNTLTRTDSVRVDTEVTNFAITSIPVEGDDVVNGAEAADGILLGGTTEPGGSVTVTFQGTTRVATVDAEGNWSAAFSGSEVPAGQYDAVAQVSTTDAAGNTATGSAGFRVDTLVDRLTLADDLVTADNVINAAEAAQGVTLSGMVERGSSVSVTFGGMVHAAMVDPSGNWSVDIPPSAIPPGELDAPVLIEATDAAGNTRDLTASVRVDTVAPDAVNVESYTRDHTGLRGISTDLTDDTVTIGHVVGSGSGTEVRAVDFAAFDIPSLGETSYAFARNVPDGSHLVITATDAAGNSSGTYLVVDDTTTSVVDMSAASTLGQFQIGSIDLQFAEDSQLTITEAQLLALSSNSDTVTVSGGADDTVTILGAQFTGTSTNAAGQNYNIFSLGDGAVLIEDDITNVVI
ncbi:Ig-like domain-containing protein, partial [Puniceibacterium confluentis]|uniref:Ig-like domain-containing protein n=1 Tax=Puniceibacterium confluentis TaxID=1958944 RepID=UPI0035633A3B